MCCVYELILYCMVFNIHGDQIFMGFSKHHRCKKEAAKSYVKALLKRYEFEMGSQGLLLLIGLNLIIMTSIENIVISAAQGLLILMGSKFLIKMTRSQNNTF